MSTERAQTSRRTALALAVSAPLALAACDLDPPSATQPSPSSSPPTLPDDEVVAFARTSIGTMLVTATSMGAAHPDLAAELAPWQRLHTAHLAALGSSLDDEALAGLEAGTPPARAGAARREFLRLEGALGDILTVGAGQTSSGDLARALASMSAAIVQRVIA